MNHTRIVIAASALALVAMPLAAQQDLGRQGTSWTWDGAMSSGQWFGLHNINGPVRVTPSGDGSVHIRAEKRVKSGGDASAVHYAVVRGARGITVCALWSDNATCDEDGSHRNSINNSDGDRRQNVEVAFEIQVPSGVKSSLNSVNGDVSATRLSGQVKARTVNGAVRAEQIGAEVSVKTVNGDVTVSTRSGPLEAETVNGSVNASLSGAGNVRMHFRSVNGAIEITTPTPFNADVELSTLNGSINSKYTLNYDRRRRHAEGTVGSGGADVSASTVNGSITLQ